MSFTGSYTEVEPEIVACILSFGKSRDKPNLENTSKYVFSPDLGGKNGGVLSMRMQVILDSSFARPGSAPIWGGKKGEFRDWTRECLNSDKILTCFLALRLLPYFEGVSQITWRRTMF